MFQYWFGIHRKMDLFGKVYHSPLIHEIPKEFQTYLEASVKNFVSNIRYMLRDWFGRPWNLLIILPPQPFGL